MTKFLKLILTLLAVNLALAVVINFVVYGHFLYVIRIIEYLIFGGLMFLDIQGIMIRAVFTSVNVLTVIIYFRKKQIKEWYE